jgi:hypothetical protein
MIRGPGKAAGGVGERLTPQARVMGENDGGRWNRPYFVSRELPSGAAGQSLTAGKPSTCSSSGRNILVFEIVIPVFHTRQHLEDN